jgi:hypothetical protein
LSSFLTLHTLKKEKRNWFFIFVALIAATMFVVLGTDVDNSEGTEGMVCLLLYFSVWIM